MGFRIANIKVKINQRKARQLDECKRVALEKTAEHMHTRIVQAQVMPFDTGTMQNESTFVDNEDLDRGHVKIVVNTPYARRLYYHPEYNFNKVDNANAQGRWLDPWINGKHKNFAKQSFEQYYRRERDRRGC